MPYFIRVNGDVDTLFVKKTTLPPYLEKRGVIETGKASGYDNYRVASGLNKEDASARLLDLAGDMMDDFDVDPTALFPRGDSRLEFANQFGIFYVDNIPSGEPIR